MSNELILRIAEARPQSLEELGQLPGMGTQRLEYYGPTLIDLIHLNPPRPEDETLLAMQRQELQNTTAERAGSAPVTPQLQRKIFLKLQEMRQKIAIEQRLKSQEVASTSLLRAISETAPGSLDELRAIRGFATSGLARADTQILALVSSLRQADEASSPQ